MDVKSAFLNGFINDEVYVAQPPGFIDFAKPNHVYRLMKALYGLKQAPKAWYDRLKDFLIKHDYTMGMEMLKKFGLEDSKPMKTPISIETKLMKDVEGGFVDNTKYRGMIGSLLYLTTSRPDIMFSVCLCARFQKDPKTSHLEAVKRIFQYVKGTMHLGLWYPKGLGIETIVYADSDHAGDYQTALAISTTEAEYVSAGKACQQALWMKQALVDYDIRKKLNHCNTSNEVDVNLPTLMPKPQSPINEPTTHSNHVSLQSHSLPLSDSCDTNVGQASISPSINQPQTQPLFPHIVINPHVASMLHAQTPLSPQGDNHPQPPLPPSPSREMLMIDINQLQDLSNLLSMHHSQPNTIAEENVPAPIRTDEQLVPVKARLPIGKSNLLMDLQKMQKNPIFRISVDILQNTNFFSAFTASADVPLIYIQQFWNTLTIDTNALGITPKDFAHPFMAPPTGDLVIDFVNNLGYLEELQFVSKMYVNSLYQPWRTVLSMINQCLTGKTSGSDRPRHPVLQIL
ncbi:retrovirus-related pol polyprotein from transposon TNT 1-94 [Tanacetum coccineum]